jgi:hypothetical protein
MKVAISVVGAAVIAGCLGVWAFLDRQHATGAMLNLRFELDTQQRRLASARQQIHVMGSSITPVFRPVALDKAKVAGEVQEIRQRLDLLRREGMLCVDSWWVSAQERRSLRREVAALDELCRDALMAWGAKPD